MSDAPRTPGTPGSTGTASTAGTAAPVFPPDPSVLHVPRGGPTPLGSFQVEVGSRAGYHPESYRELHRWSIENPGAFWTALWDEEGVIGERGERAIVGAGLLDARFFPDAKLSFAENLLHLADRPDGEDALVFRGEDRAAERMGWGELRALVGRLRRAMRAMGIGAGDRVAAMMPNTPATVALMLAASSIGAVWSSCSPDFGERGVLDRFGQIEPSLFVATEGYWYAGRWREVGDKVAAIADALGCPTVIAPYPDGETEGRTGSAEALAERIGGRTLGAFAAGGGEGGSGDGSGGDGPPEFERPEFERPEFERLHHDHPLYVLFSSGTTGAPKCIVHGQGGTLLQHLKEHRLHAGVMPGDRVFFFTTCGWMMWNWLVSGLAAGATLMLYDGSPFHPGPEVLFDYAAEERFTFFGTSAKFIDAARKSGIRPADTHDLTALRGMGSTGSPLAPEGFRWVYDAIKPDAARTLHLASMSGGTDIVSCFVLGVPTEPVRVGEIQGPGLGMAVDVWDEEGRPVVGQKGELVCTRPFPSRPIGFWNDPDGARYRAAYFERFPDAGPDGGPVWAHGDFAEWTRHGGKGGGMIIHGRSDATLNPQGVRIGTAEIYGPVERLDEVLESVAIGQEWDGDVRVVLFVRLADGHALDEALAARIRTTVRENASPRHVPAVVAEVADIPRTKSGKIVELAVREVVHGREVRNTDALANPEALALFRDRPELRG